ncbi:MAG: pentapeptide repeat-containing protein [Betaproteobacteria bacterium]|nr:pentapeptide repeat-containing protein [Betaproteobacteria bacterium]
MDIRRTRWGAKPALTREGTKIIQKRRIQWYVQAGRQIEGPFPARVVRERLLLGRLLPGSLVSVDGEAWAPAIDFDPLIPMEWHLERRPPDEDARRWRGERLAAAQRWADERRARERRIRARAAADAARSDRRGADRRTHPEPPETRAWRERRARGSEAAAPDFRGALGALGLLVAGLVLAATVLPPVEPVPVRLSPSVVACAATPRDRVDWRGCDKAGAWLKGAALGSANLARMRLAGANLAFANLSYADLEKTDLSHADLRYARLRGADLAGANLAFAVFVGADLRNADFRGAALRGADMTGARLGRALWTDGKPCAAGSVGSCARAHR